MTSLGGFGGPEEAPTQPQAALPLPRQGLEVLLGRVAGCGSRDGPAGCWDRKRWFLTRGSGGRGLHYRCKRG